MGLREVKLLVQDHRYKLKNFILSTLPFCFKETCGHLFYFALPRFLWLFLTIAVMENKSYLSHIPVREYKCNHTHVRSWVLWIVWRQWITNVKVLKGDKVLKVFHLNDYMKKKNKMNIWMNFFLLNDIMHFKNFKLKLTEIIRKVTEESQLFSGLMLRILLHINWLSLVSLL